MCDSSGCWAVKSRNCSLQWGWRSCGLITFNKPSLLQQGTSRQGVRVGLAVFTCFWCSNWNVGESLIPLTSMMSQRALILLQAQCNTSSFQDIFVAFLGFFSPPIFQTCWRTKGVFLWEGCMGWIRSFSEDGIFRIGNKMFRASLQAMKNKTRPLPTLSSCQLTGFETFLTALHCTVIASLTPLRLIAAASFL